MARRMIAFLYAYLTRLGWLQSAAHTSPPRAAYSPLTADVTGITAHVDRVVVAVDAMAAGRIPYPGDSPPYGEVLVAEVRRLRVENAELRADLADAKYREEHDGY